MLRQILVIVLVVASAAGLSATPAEATPTAIRVDVDDPTPGAAWIPWTWNWTGFQTASTVRCISFQFTTTPTGSTPPAGFGTVGGGIFGSYVGGDAFTEDAANSASGIWVYNGTTGVTPNPSNGDLQLMLMNPSSAGIVYVRLTTYSAFGTGTGSCGGSVLDATTMAAVAIIDATTVSATVLPSMTFSVSGKASACNGESSFDGASGGATTVDFGRVAAGATTSGAQSLSMSSNASGGFLVYLRGSLTTQNLRSAGHMWTDVLGTYGTPAALGAGERFGWTYQDSTASSSVSNPASAMFIKLDDTDRAVMGSGSSASGTGCVAFAVQSTSTTPAGAYDASVIYTAVPTF